MQHIFIYFLLCGFLSGLSYKSWGQSLNKKERYQALINNLYVYPDNQNLSFGEVLAKNQFLPYQDNLIQTNIQTYWLKLHFKVPEENPSSVFIFNFNRAEEVLWYDAVTQKIIGKAGFGLAWAERPFKVGVNATLPITFVSSNRILYFRIQNKHSFSKEKIKVIFDKLNYYPIGDFEQAQRIENQYSYLYLGILLGFAIYHLFLFLTVKHKPYLYLGLFGLTLMVFRLNHSGILLEFFPHWSPSILPELMYLNAIPTLWCYIMFSWYYLNIRSYLPRFKKMLVIYRFVLIAYGTLVFTQIWWLTHFVAFLISIISLILTLYFAIQISKKYKPAKYFIFPNAFVLFQVLIVALYYADWWPQNWYSDSVTTGGGLTVLLFFSISLTGYRNIQALRREAKQRNIIKLQETVNKNLEKKARMRMQEIESQNEELKALAYHVQNINLKLEEEVKSQTQELQESYQKLLETEKKTKYIISAIDSGLIFTDAKANEDYFSIQNYTMLGYKPYEFPAKQESWTRLIHPKDRGAILQAFSTLFFEENDFYEINYRMKTKNEDYKWIMERGKVMERSQNGQPIKIIGTRVDINKIKLTEQNLIETSKAYKNTQEALNESALVLKLDKNGKIIYINELFCQVFQYTKEELIEKEWKYIVLECQTEIFYKYLWLTIFSGHIWKGDIKMKNKQKDYFWTATVINPITDQDGEIIEYLIIGQEITTRKKIAVESKRLLAELTIHTQDLEQFADIVSHNLRQPVAHIQGLASLIDIENPISPTNVETLNKMKEAAMNMDTVFTDVNKILETRTDVTLAKQNIYVEDMLNRLVQHFNKQLTEVEGNVIIDCDDVQNVFSVRNNLETAISNLINNAIKYRNPEKKLIIHIKVEKTSQFILFHVEDNGLGIDIQRFQNKIFALYQRFHLHVQGKGLGLHMAKNLIKAIGGNITLKSQENIGTTFTIQIPLIS